MLGQRLRRRPNIYPAWTRRPSQDPGLASCMALLALWFRRDVRDLPLWSSTPAPFKIGTPLRMSVPPMQRQLLDSAAGESDPFRPIIRCETDDGWESKSRSTNNYNNPEIREGARILKQVTIYRRRLISRDGYLDQSEAHDISQPVRAYGSRIRWK